MGIGHVAVGLGLKSVHRRLNAGLLIFAALFADFLLGWFVLAGWENYQAPPDYSSKHYLLFTFPWSHGLLPDIGWALVFGGAVWLLLHDRLAATLAGAAVLTHYLLDGLVHVQGLPVAGEGTPALGLGLWRNLPVESAIEAAMAATALFLYWRLGSARRIGMAVYIVLVGVITIAGQATATEVPGRSGLIAGWLSVPLAMAGIAGWIDRRA